MRDYWSRVARRAFSDTVQFLGLSSRSRLLVSLVLFVIAILILNRFATREEVDQMLNWVIATVLAAAVFFIPTFLIHLVIAPMRMDREARQKIGFLQEQLSRKISIESPQQLIQLRPTVPGMEQAGWILYLANIRITNQSATPVSVSFALHVALQNNPSGKDKLTLVQDQPLLVDILRSRWERYLSVPLNIAPHTTIMGDLGFWILPPVEGMLGGDLSAVMRRVDDDQYRELDAQIEVTDFVSDSRIVMRVPGRYPANVQT